MNKEAFDQLIETETARIIHLQEDLGLDVIVSGELGSDNYSSFVADHLGGVSMLSMNEVAEHIQDKKQFEISSRCWTYRRSVCTMRSVPEN
ncbi:MAG: hypothetical protein Q4A55_01775 [Aerococcus sp.]|nr:hypothetical protein [Aerococcus sp.]